MLRVEIKEYPNVGVINLKGEFVCGELEAFELKTKRICDNYDEIGVSFEGVKFIDSSGLGLLIQLHKCIKKKEGKLYIFGLEGNIKETFRIAQLLEYFNVMSKKNFEMVFIGREYDMDFSVHKPVININELKECISSKVSIDIIGKILDREPDTKFFYEEDTNIYKRGKALQEADLEQLKKRGYETIWITSIEKSTRSTDDQGSLVREIRGELETAVSSFYKVFNESDVKRGSRGALGYFDGEDLFKSQLNPLQKEGAQKLYQSIFGENTKISQIKTLLEKILYERLVKVDMFSSRSIGALESNNHGYAGTRMDEITNSIVDRSVESAIMFLATCNRISRKRSKGGHQISTKRLEKGEKKGYDKNKRSLFSTELIVNASYGVLFHDFGFNHSRLREILGKELKQLKDGNGEYIKDSSVRLSEEERVLIKRHVYVTNNIMSSDPESIYASAIADNIIKFHHCMLNGGGYPDRKHYTENRQIRFNVPLHELTRIFSIINFYTSMLDRKPYRLPIRRSSLVKYMIDNAVPNTDDGGNPDPEGIWDIDTTVKQKGLFDGYLLGEFFKTINLYKIGESVILASRKSEKVFPATIYENNNEKPHRPIVNVYMKDKWGKIDLANSQYDDWCVDDLHETLVFKH